MSAAPSLDRAARFVDRAYRYAELGWVLIRCEGKRPKGEGWQRTRPEGPDLAAGKWSEWGRRWNMGVVCGPSGLAIIDVDRDDADEAVRELLGELPRTPTVRTGRGRLQVYFRDPGGLSKTVRDGLELRVGEHQCVLPPSVHPDTGREYAWIEGLEPWSVELASVPQTVLDYLAESRPNGRAAPLPEEISEGERHEKLLSAAGTMRRRGMGEAAIRAALLEENQTRCKPPLPDAEVEELARDVAGRYAPTTGQPAVPGSGREAAPGAGSAEGWHAGDNGVELVVETWREFAAAAGERVPCLVEGLWPERALGFVSAPPKAGKTWLGLELALSVATGRPLFGRFAVPKPGPVLYVALEGDRAALRARVGCLARGLGIDPDGEIPHLHWAYKPRGINLASPEWAEALARRAEELGAVLVVVDVLRRAADYEENSSREFMALCRQLEPLADQGCSLAFLHHFGKLSEINRDRTPAERMAGTGAKFGALDVGLFITGSENGARRLRIVHECRDLAEAAAVGVELTGEGSGPNGGFTYYDTCYVAIADELPGETELKAPPSEIFAFLVERGGRAKPAEVREQFGISEATERRRRPDVERLGASLETDTRGHVRAYVVRADNAAAVTVNPSRDAIEAWRLANPPGYAESQPSPSQPSPGGDGMSEVPDLQGVSASRHPVIPTGSALPVTADPQRDGSEEAA